MGFLRVSLTTLLLVAALLPAAARAAAGCLSCHPRHYADAGPCGSCHKGDERTDRKNIAHRGLIPAAYAWFALPGSPAVRAGERRIEASSCRRCHGWKGSGNALAADLDEVAVVSSPLAIHEAIRTPAAYMPDFRFADGQIREVVNAILSAGLRAPRKGAAETPIVVHFEDPAGERDLLFPRHCGGCHKLLSAAWGGLGSGSAGPNLSGLFTSHYPPSFGAGERWTSEKLGKWIRNPRSVKPGALMPPVTPDAKATDGVLRFLSGAAREE